MANTKIGTANWIETNGTLKNGTGGGAPALDETTPYTMSKVLTSDRYSLWKTGATPGASPVNLDIDLGANRTVTCATIHGYRPGTGTGVTSLKIYSQPSSAGYPPAGWTLQGTLNQGSLALSQSPRDAGVVFASVSQRYWRFEFTHGGGAWSAGKLGLWNPTDLGAIHTPGGLDAPFRNRLETPLPSGAVVLADLGDPGRDIVHPWEQIESTLRNTLLGLHDKTGSFLLIDSETNPNFYEVYLRRGRVPVGRDSHILYDITLDMARLP